MVKKTKNDPMVKSKKGTSPNGETKLLSFSGCGLGRVRDFNVKFAMMRRNRIMKAQIFIAQAKPTSVIK